MPLGGRCGLLLANCLGCALEEFLHAFDRVNLLQSPPPRQLGGRGKGREFPLVEAMMAARSLDLEGRHVVLAGKRVALAFGIKRVRWLEPVELGKGESSCFVICHPSGICRFWNDACNRQRVGECLKSLISCGPPNLPKVPKFSAGLRRKESGKMEGGGAN